MGFLLGVVKVDVSTKEAGEATAALRLCISLDPLAREENCVGD
jgi:hypothetical protein